MFLKKNNLALGLTIGLLAPLLGLVALYFLRFPSAPFLDFLRFFAQENALITSLGSICLLINVVFFTIYINTARDETAKGIFATTVLYGILILLLKVLN